MKMLQLIAPSPSQQAPVLILSKPKRLIWLESIRIIAAVMISLYHAQIYFSNYAFTPKPVGLVENLKELLAFGSETNIILPIRLLSAPFWFGFQFLDVFILISGFSLVLSLKGQPLVIGQFLKKRLSRLLFPFWTVAWLAFPILWILGALTHTYAPDAWHSFVGMTFPLAADYRGSLLLSTSGPWWFIPLIISFTLVFPLLWSLAQRWGVRNLLLFSSILTVVYRMLAIYLLGGHPTYVVMSTPANEEPFQLFLSKLIIFVIGIAVAVVYQKGQGPIFWSHRRAIIVGFFLYAIGFVCQFYQLGWAFADLLLPLGLALVAMALTRRLSSIPRLQPWLLRLGACSYSYFLIHNFVVDRTLNLVVQGDLVRYLLMLPVMIGLTLVLAMGVDSICPIMQQFVIALWNKVDSALSQPHPAKY
ncbi:MAG TPA: acyltransferase family protein [Leptolyngbyaceae cyanobacterium]